MSPIRFLILAGLAISGSFPGNSLSCFAAGPVELNANAGQLEVRLPNADKEETFLWLESSNDLIHWDSLARYHELDWENVFPYALPIYEAEASQLLVDSPPAEGRYYRVMERPVKQLENRQSISRFLQQATFGPSLDLINAFPGIDAADLNEPPYRYYNEWIDEQIAAPVFSLRAFWRERSDPAYSDNTANDPFEVGHNPAYGTQLNYYLGRDRIRPDSADAVAAGRPSNDVIFNNTETKKIVWFQAVLSGEDALRQRVAWALSQIFVVGESGSNQPGTSERFLSYYDIFVRNAFGNFRDILTEVTWHPAMGYYLTSMNNQKADLQRGTFPDENYARELMQLFTIGLWMFEQDGTLALDDNGQSIPTYDNEDIEEFAKVFTGMIRERNRDNIEILGGNYVDPMRVRTDWHDFSPKILLDGNTLGPFPENEEGVRADVEGLLDHLFNHPNTPVFISRLMIQRLTISNPSPGYIRDVAQAFIDGKFGEWGSGARGDMQAVIKAILLHREARTPVLGADPVHGKLREPIARLMHYARAFRITPEQTYGLFPFYQLDSVISQSPFEAPSVFNFYLPDYQPIGEIGERGLFAPEFQIHTDVTSLNLANAIRTLVYEGIRGEIGARDYSQGFLDLSYELSLADDAEALIDHLDLLLTAGRLEESNRSILLEVLEEMASGSTANSYSRVRKALSLFALLPEFSVIY